MPLEARQGAPRPGHASGIATRRADPYRAAWIARGALFIPRWALELAFSPVRLSLWAYDEWALGKRAVEILFNDARTFGIWPVLFVETGFGANAGVRLLHRDLFGHGERVFLRASWGGLYRQIYEGQFGLGDLLGDRVAIDFRGRYETQPNLRFYGVGNGDEASIDAQTQIYPRLSATQVSGVPTRYRRDRAVWGGRIAFRLGPTTTFQITHAWTWADFSRPKQVNGDRALADVYAPSTVTGYADGLLNAYTEGALSFERLEHRGRHISKATPSAGWRLRVWTGFAEGVARDPSRFVRTGAEVQRFVDLWRGDRVLRLRGRFDMVHGALSRIPFTELPVLGGPHYLRGYIRDRFRDRVSGVVTAEYFYPIIRTVSGYLFVDVGRVWRSPQAIGTEGWKDLRLGYGGGFEVHTLDAFLMRLQLASSIDGGFFLQFQFSPTFSIRDFF